jgi:uncharacterized protein YndB with AHSA1/START domain
MTQHIEYTVIIYASPSVVWEALTDIDLMQRWMGEPEMQIVVTTDWKVGSAFVVQGFHHELFENKGTVLRFDAPEWLRYSHLSSVSRLPDIPENQTIFDFRLVPMNADTSLTVTLSVFPTESILKHVDFYWRVTIGLLKEFIENRQRR